MWIALFRSYHSHFDELCCLAVTSIWTRNLKLLVLYSHVFYCKCNRLDIKDWWLSSAGCEMLYLCHITASFDERCPFNYYHQKLVKKNHVHQLSNGHCLFNVNVSNETNSSKNVYYTFKFGRMEKVANYIEENFVCSLLISWLWNVYFEPYHSQLWWAKCDEPST